MAIKEQVVYHELFKDGSKYFAAGLMMFLVTFASDYYLPANWLALISEVVLGVIVYTGLLILFKAQIVLEAKKLIKR